MAKLWNTDDIIIYATNKVDFVLDGIHFGRGDIFIDKDTNKQSVFRTKKVAGWKIIGDKLESLEATSIKDFYDEECYLISWNYEHIITNIKTKEKTEEEEGTIYFYWKGANASKGFSPLPEEVINEETPVERIVQWSEPPIFLRLFNGQLIIHSGKRESFQKTAQHLYLLRGEIEEEAHLIEVPCCLENFRSKTSFLFSDSKNICIWHGRYSTNQCRKVIRYAARSFSSNIKEIEENESDSVLNLIPKSELQRRPFQITNICLDLPIRLFYFNQITGTLLATEVQQTCKNEHVTPFPYLQIHLYSATEPAIFLLDNINELWIWQRCGKSVEINEAKFQNLRHDVYNIVKSYSQNKEKKNIPIKWTFAGIEPPEFTHLFPQWKPVANLEQNVTLSTALTD